MRPDEAPRLHHLLQGGTWQCLRPTGDIQWVFGVWLYGSSADRKQRVNAGAGTCPGGPPEKKTGIKGSDTAKVHFGIGKVPAGNLPGPSGKASRRQWPSSKRMRWCSGLALWHEVPERRCRRKRPVSAVVCPSQQGPPALSFLGASTGMGMVLVLLLGAATCTHRKHLFSLSSSHTQPPHQVPTSSPPSTYFFAAQLY